MKKIFLSVCVLALTFFPSLSVYGADYLPKDKESGGNVVVSSEGYKNLYVGGGSVIINTKILGDLFSAGGSINLSGEVEEDFFAAGGNMTVSAPILGDAGILGGNVIINAPISGDLLVAGGTVSLGAGASVGGDLWIGGGVVNITAPVVGNLKIAGGEIYLNSQVGGTLDIQADEKLTFGPQAVALGSINYCGDKDPKIEEGAQVGSITKIEKTNGAYDRKDGDNMLLGFSLLKNIMLLVASLVLLCLMRERVNEITHSVYTKFWQNVGNGFVFMIILPIISILLVFTIFGMMLGMALMLGYIFLMIFSGIMTVFSLGHFVEKWVENRKNKGQEGEVQKITPSVTWQSALLGTLTGIVLSFVPIIGWITLSIVCLGTFGTIIHQIKQKALI